MANYMMFTVKDLTVTIGIVAIVLFVTMISIALFRNNKNDIDDLY